VTVAPGDSSVGVVWRCTNPFAATGGADAETAAQIRDRAPQQIKAGLLTLTTPADYQDAALAFSPPDATTSPWAREARAALRWTGSWLSTLTVVDLMKAEPAATEQGDLAALAEQLTARRLAGSENALALARYRWLDLRISCRAERSYRAAEVEATVLARLDPGPAADGISGFFGRDRWAFQQPLEAAALTAAVQSCAGIAGVTRIQYRDALAKGPWRPLPPVLSVAPREILRIDNDRNEPEHGLLFVTAEVDR
jgi:hypothetical protein